MKRNLILLTDSYKLGHFKQYPKGTTNIYSYFESRGGEFAQTIFFGLQYYIIKYLQGVVVTKEDVDEAQDFAGAHLCRSDSFNRAGWMRIVDVHGGRLPVRIKAVPEGSLIPTHNVLMTVENTDPELPWLTNVLETILSMAWYPTTVATNSHQIMSVLRYYSDVTSDEDYSGLSVKCHDFGFRGSTSVESSGIGGLAHLTSFVGTDTLSAITTGRDFYGEPMAGFSIPASEHSTMTAWGRLGEYDAFKNMLDEFPVGTIACVSDQYDIMHAVKDYWGVSLKKQIMERDGTLVIRPDSGDPVVTTLKVVEALWESFGGHTNSKGYKVLDPHIRMIQGDGIDRMMIGNILYSFEAKGYSIDNIAFGSGGGLLQKFDRDTCKFAFKCSSAVVDGKEIDVRKTPLEYNADGDYIESFKTSKRGRLALVETERGPTTVVCEGGYEASDDMLQTVFQNGFVMVDDSLSAIRERVFHAHNVLEEV